MPSFFHRSPKSQATALLPDTSAPASASAKRDRDKWYKKSSSTKVQPVHELGPAISHSPGERPLSLVSTSTRKSVGTAIKKKFSIVSLKSNKSKSPDLAGGFEFVVPSSSPPMPSFALIAGQTNANAMNDSQSSSSLAVKLQDLAQANQDGLLDDEEYRELRQALFEKASNITENVGLGLGIDENKSTTTLRYNKPVKDKSLRNSLRPRSILSTRGSLLSAPNANSSSRASILSTGSNSIFNRLGNTKSAASLRSEWDAMNASHASSLSREQLASSNDGNSVNDNDNDSTYSASQSSSNGFPSSRRTGSSNVGEVSNFGVRSTAQTLFPPTSSIPLHRAGTFNSTKSGNSRPSISSAYPQSLSSISAGNARRSYVTHSFETGSSSADHHTYASSDEIKEEIKALEEEFLGVDQQFQGLIDRAKEKHARPIIQGQTANIDRRDTITPNTNNKNNHARTTKQAEHIEQDDNTTTTKSTVSLLMSPVKLRSRLTRRRQTTSSTISSPKSPSLILSSPEPDQYIDEIQFDSPTDEKLYAEETARIKIRRAKVAEGYSKRLEYLQARLRGAEIRERLPT